MRSRKSTTNSVLPEGKLLKLSHIFAVLLIDNLGSIGSTHFKRRIAIGHFMIHPSLKIR